jgi:hypothetical protein
VIPLLSLEQILLAYPSKERGASFEEWGMGVEGLYSMPWGGARRVVLIRRRAFIEVQN